MALSHNAVETTFINTWAEVGARVLRVPIDLRKLVPDGVDLLDINFVLKTGLVIRSGMIGSRGLWLVRGTTVDEMLLDIQVAVESEEWDVELLRVECVD